MKRSVAAANKFMEGYNCAQAVLFAYTDKMNISRDLALKAASGFGGGMGRKQEVCGAVSGGILALGIIHGRGENDDKQQQESVYAKVRELIDRFETRFSSVNCRELLEGCDLMTPEGKNMFLVQDLRQKCCEYVREAVMIINEITGLDDRSE